MLYSYDRRTSSDSLVDGFRTSVIQAVKHVGDLVRALGLGSVVKYNPQERIDEDSRSIHATFWLKFDHSTVNPAWRPGIFFYWDKSKESGMVSCSNLVWKNTKYANLPLAKMGGAMKRAAQDIVKDLKRQLDRKESDEAWSVVSSDEGYATDVDVFDSKLKAEAEARSRGNCYVVKGTQMWNEPLGQVEEHDRPATYKFFP